MKKALFFLLVFPLVTQAFVDGQYTCGTNSQVNTFLVKTLRIDGTAVPYLEVKKVVKNDTGEELNTFIIKGVPTHSINEKSGREYMGLGSMTIEFKDGKPACVKD